MKARMRPYDHPTTLAGADDAGPAAGGGDHNPAACRGCRDWNDVAGECSLEERERMTLCGWRPPKREAVQRSHWPLFADRA